MWLKRFTDYLLRHRLQTILLTFFITFIPVIGILGILIAALITLIKGVVEGAILTLAATLPYLISFYATTTNEATIPLAVWAAIGVAVLSNVLTFVFAVMLLRKTSWGLIIQIAALLGVLVISIVHLLYPSVTEWWGNQLQSYYTQAQLMTGMLKNSATTSNELKTETVNITKHYATGLMVAAILFNAILQLIIARWWQAAVYHPGILRKELHNIRLSHLAGILFIISLIFSYLGNSVVSDIMPVLYILFGSAGLSLVHYFFGLRKSPTVWVWVIVFYLTLILALPMSLIFLSLFGLIDIWLDIRKRFRKDLGTN